jgi:tetratricopeptide (TPR) repeat protein
MKRLAIIILGLTVVAGAYSQPNQRTAAFNHLRYGRLDKAKEAIDKAVEHSKTINDERTWFYRGNVYLAIHLTDEEQYMDLDPDALKKADEAYARALELDEKGDYTDEIKERILVVAEQYFNEGVNYYNENNYTEASKSFKKSGTINDELGVIDTVAFFYTAQSAYFAEELDVSKNYFNKLKELDYEEPAIYRFLAEIHKVESDTTTALNVIKEGREKFPDDFSLIIEETNIYLAANEQDKAMDLLQLAIEKDDTNPTLFFAVATNYDQMGNFEEAEENYLKAIELDPDFFDPNYNLGALYVNKAIEIMEEANELPLDEEQKYNELKVESDDLLKKSIPYLEKADQLNPGDDYVLRTLRDIYARLGMLDKLKEIEAQID